MNNEKKNNKIENRTENLIFIVTRVDFITK